MCTIILYLFISLELIATNTEGIRSKKSVPNKLHAPINIKTSKVVSVTPAKPLTLYVEEHSLEIVKNTGEEIMFYPLPFTRTSITGGLLPSNNVYRVHRNYLTINQNVKGRTGGTINGKGYPVTGAVVFINVLYGTYENAVKHDDGLVVLTEPVKVNSIPNPDFEPFEEILRSGKLREPNSTTVTSTKNIYSWYSTFPISHSYFIYQGSFYNPETKREISNATHIVTHPPFNHISYKQHDAFKNVLGNNDKPMETITRIYPRKNRTVETSDEVQPVPLPFSEIVFLLQLAYLFFFGTST